MTDQWICGSQNDEIVSTLMHSEYDLDEWGRCREVRVDYSGHENTLPETGSEQLIGLADQVNDLQEAMAGQPLVTSMAFDPRSNVTVVRDASGRTTGAGYDPFDRPVASVDGEGRILRGMIYDQGGRVTQIDHQDPTNPNPAPGGGDLARAHERVYLPGCDWVEREGFDVGSSTNYLYDVRGRVAQSMGPRGMLSIYEYDLLDRVTKVTRMGQEIQYGYDANGNLTQVTVFNPATNAFNAMYGYAYDNANRRIQATYPGGGAETWTYNARGYVSSYQDANGNDVLYTYDGMGRLIAELYDDFNRMITRSYDNAGRVTYMSDNAWNGQQWVEDSGVLVNYDSAGRVLEKVTSVNGAVFRSVVYYYDAAGNRIAMDVADGEAGEERMYFYQWTAGNRVDRIWTFDGALNLSIDAQFDYDSGGRLLLTLLSFEGDEELRILRTYTDRAWTASVRSETELMSLRTQYDYQYDVVGNCTQIEAVHLDNMTIDYAYDPFDRLISESWSGAQTGDVTVDPYWASYTYDFAGNRTSKLTLTGYQLCEYSAASRLTTETRSEIDLLDADSVSASSTEQGYSADVIIDGDTGSTPAWRSVESGAEHVVTLDLGTVQPVARVRLFTPADAGDMEQFRVQVNLEGSWQTIYPLVTSGATPHSMSEWWVQTNRQVEFGFTPVLTRYVRFVQASGGGGSDPDIAWLNELEVFGTDVPEEVIYLYDTAGNLTQKTWATNRETFGYNHTNRMSSYLRESNATGSWVTQEQAVYGYLPTGQRHLRHELVRGGSEVDELSWFLHDGDDVVLDYAQDGEGNPELERAYVNGMGIDTKIGRVDVGTGDGFFYVPDALGSVREVTDTGGSIVSRRYTTAWGESLPGVSGSNEMTDRHGFAQREHEPESGLVFMRNRSYDPRIGRFTQTDPILANRPIEHYVYARGNPIRYTDPMGLEVTDNDRETWRWMVIRMWNAKAKGNAALFYSIKNDMKFFANQLIKGQGKTDYKGQEEAQNMYRQVLAVPDLVEVKPTVAQINEELGYLNSIGDSLRETISSLETQYEVAWWVDKGSTAVSLLAGAGFISAGAKAAFTQGGAKALFGYIAREGGQVAAGVAADQAIEQATTAVCSMASISPGDKETLLKFIGVLRAMVKKQGTSASGKLDVTSKPRTVDEALTIGHRWLGPGYKEIGPGVFRSADGTRQFRMTDRDIMGKHGDIGPHVHYEKFHPVTGDPIKNIHTPLSDP